MRFESKAMAVPTAPGTGAAILVDRFTEKTVLVGGTFTATISVQGSLDGSTYADLTGNITAPGAHAIPETVRYLRIRTAAWTSSPAVSFGGFDARAV